MALSNAHLDRIRACTSREIKDKQATLRDHYRTDPTAARVTDHAQTSDGDIPASHPIHTQITCGQGVPVEIPISVHRAVGGESDFPCPGDILAAALASCFDTAIRMIATLKGIPLTHLSVSASLTADVRGTLMMDRDVPVGFQDLTVKVDLHTPENVRAEQAVALLEAAEHCCVVLQTLRAPPNINLERVINGAIRD